MRKQLVGYTINGQVVGVDLQQWNIPNDQPPFKIINSDTVPSGYTDISTIIYWDKFGSEYVNDYLVCKDQIRILVDDNFTGLTSTEKDIAIQYYAFPDATQVVMYLMMEKGMSQQEAQYFIIQQWHKNHKGVIDACAQRWYYVKFIAPMFLSFSDCEDLFGNPVVLSLLAQLNELGLVGIPYGDEKDGIMNFVESTNSYVGKGLKEMGYTLQQGTWDDFIGAIHNVMVEGIYDKYIN